MALPTQLVHIRLAKELLPKLDDAAQQLWIDRSEYIRQAIIEKLRGPQKLPSDQGVNILMTDLQLEEMQHILRLERARRRNRGTLQGRQKLLS